MPGVVLTMNVGQSFLSFLQQQMAHQHFEVVAVAVVDFATREIACCELANGQEVASGRRHFFDLASLTKPLTLGLIYLRSPQWFTPQMRWLLNHQAGLPAHGRLQRQSWRETITGFPLRQSATIYSDYSALRLQLMLGPHLEAPWVDYLAQDWGSEIYFWQQLPKWARELAPCYGERGGKPICGEVHDENCFNLQEFTAHAGLFSSLQGLAECLLRLNERYGLLEHMALQVSQEGQRFVGGWDTTRGISTSLAGDGTGKCCFGHLGFTGTSMWIDPEKKLGQILLTNGTRDYCYSRAGLNSLRRNIGTWIWQKGGF